MSQQQGESAPSAEAPEAPARSVGIWRLPRRAIARYLQLLGRHRFVGCLLGLIILLALCGLSLSAARWLAPGDRSLAPLEEVETNEVGTLLLTQEDGVEEYLDGMADFDAARMWGAYAEVVRAEMAARGRSVEELQRGLDQARRNGAAIASRRPLGTYPLRDGRRYVFYIVRRTGFPPNGGAEELYFVFTVDPSGKILNIT